jgi:Tol biopolymer transport system component
MTGDRDLLEREMERLRPRPISIDDLVRRRDRRRRNQRIAAGVIAIAIFAAPIAWLAGAGGRSDRTHLPAASSSTPVAVGPGVPDYVIDLRTGVTTLLPDAIIRSAADTGLHDDGSTPYAQYAATPDGTMLAYVGHGDDGSLQIFTARIDGSGVRQVTHAPTGATSPAWSPDGTMVAYVGDPLGVGPLFVLDVATGRARRVAMGAAGPQFTPDGGSVLYSARSVLRTVSVTGGRSALLIGPGEGVHDAFGGSLSPDGSLVTFRGSGWPRSETFHCGPCSFVANADGTDRRVIPGFGLSAAGAWSPDGSRIVASGAHNHILVIDVATGHATRVADGTGAIWLDDHTLLVEA